MISERLDNSNEKCKPMFGLVHKNPMDCHPKIPGSNPCFIVSIKVFVQPNMNYFQWSILMGS